MRFPFFLFLLLPSLLSAQQYATRQGQVHFLSETPIEDIEATSSEASVILDLTTGRVAAQVPMLSFHFEKALMEEHFNENYMESSRFPKAKFQGSLVDFQGLLAEGETPVVVKGSFEVHGVAVERSFSGTLEKTKKGVALHCLFDVATADHEIPIPSVVRDNIAASIAVDITATLVSR